MLPLLLLTISPVEAPSPAADTEPFVTQQEPRLEPQQQPAEWQQRQQLLHVRQRRGSSLVRAGSGACSWARGGLRLRLRLRDRTGQCDPLCTVKSDDGDAPAVTWSNPVLIEAPSAANPRGPGVPQHYFGFDYDSVFGMGQAATPGWPSVNGSWQFSSDGGLSWTQSPGFSTTDGAALIPFVQTGAQDKKRLDFKKTAGYLTFSQIEIVFMTFELTLKNGFSYF